MKHIFCYEHIKTWAKEKSTCPLCNEEFRALETNRNRAGKFLSKEPIAAPRIPDDMRGLGLDDEWPEMWAAFSATQREEQIREQRLQINRLRRSRRLLREAGSEKNLEKKIGKN